MNKYDKIIMILLAVAILCIFFAFIFPVVGFPLFLAWVILVTIAIILIVINCDSNHKENKENKENKNEEPTIQILYISESKEKKYTRDITYAKNFKKFEDVYIEKERRNFRK